MAQFDVFRLGDGTLVVDLQTDLIGLDVTRLVAPLRDKGRYVAFPKLTPEIAFGDRAWIVRVQEMAAVSAAELGQSVGRADEARDALLDAIDILVRGF